MKMVTCPASGLLIPENFIEEKHSLKKSINEIVEKAINSVKIKDNYFLVLHAKFDDFDGGTFVVSKILASLKIPGFRSNQQVFFVSPKRGICELLWMVAPKKPGEKLKVEFNTNGVTYLQAKGAMPS